MKKPIALAACTAAGIFILGLAACSKPTTENTTTSVNSSAPTTAPAGTEVKAADKALVRFINATNQTADLNFGDLKAFSAVPAGGTTPYMELPAERHDFKLYPTGSATGSEAPASNSEGLTAGNHYTILAAVNDNNKLSLNPSTDVFDKPAPGRSKLRVINASTAAGDVDIWVAGTNNTMFSGVGFNHATDYKEVDPTLAEIDVRRGGSKKDELKITDLNLKPDKFYSVVVMGSKGNPIKYQVIEDQLTPPRG
jgi:uncharacterized protein DUF4397